MDLGEKKNHILIFTTLWLKSSISFHYESSHHTLVELAITVTLSPRELTDISHASDRLPMFIMVLKLESLLDPQLDLVFNREHLRALVCGLVQSMNYYRSMTRE